MTTAAIARPTAPFSSRGRTLALGFGTAVAMWAVGYVAMMKPGLVLGEVLFAATLACLFVGGWVAGRSLEAGESAPFAGIRVGLAAGAVNLLLIGSLIGGEPSERPAGRVIAWVLGNLVVSGGLAAMGAVAGALRPVPGTARPWFHRFTCVGAATVFLLLITGGLVTGLEAGLAVPDWPNSFGHNMLLYPLSEMVGGVYYEHAHRLYGMLVGVTAITLVAGAFVLDRRPSVRVLAVAYLAMVCAQGIIGGTRVADQNVVLAVVHGVFGQVVFATICVIAAVTSPTWLSDRRPMATPRGSLDRTSTTALAVMLVTQLALGATYRHLLHVHVLYTHIMVAVLVLGLVIFAGGRAWAKRGGFPVLPQLGKALMHASGLQIVLGVVAMIAVWSRPSTPPTAAGESTPLEQIPVWEVVFTTAHQATGALLLALAVLLMAWTRRLITPDEAASA